MKEGVHIQNDYGAGVLELVRGWEVVGDVGGEGGRASTLVVGKRLFERCSVSVAQKMLSRWQGRQRQTTRNMFDSSWIA